MIIGIDASRANTTNRTGTEWYSFHVIQELKELIPEGFEVVLYTKEPLLEDLADLPQNWSSKVLTWKPELLWTQLRLSWEMLWHKPDMLYIPAHTIPLIHPKHILLVVHDVGFERQDELYNNTMIGKESRSFVKRLINVTVRVATLGKYGAYEQDYHRFSMEMAVKHATKIITISQFSKSEIQDVYGIEDERMAVILNGFNKRPEPTEQEITHVKEKYGKLVLAGSPGFQYEEVQRRIKKHALGAEIIETGYVDEEDVGPLMKAALAFTLPSLYEGFGLPILEAMQLGVPVVCSNIPPLQEIGKSIPLYFDPNNPEEMAEQFYRVTHEDTAQRVEDGIVLADYFDWQGVAGETWAEMKKMIDVIDV